MGITAAIMLRARPAAAIFLAPILWRFLVYAIGIVAVSLGLVAP